ncbi:MAG: DUF177 domain-containing protein [Bacteroidales bacterium]|nr:DUF177 domain-containing protein [Bacteroidales bacterium]
MGKFNKYKIDLENISDETVAYSYELSQDFFDIIDHEGVTKGDVKAELTVKRTNEAFEFDFHLFGAVQIPCDRCLDEMDQEIDTINRLVVKYGVEYSEESDELIIFPEDRRIINIAWYLYEFIVLNIPIKHVHEIDKCNKEMISKYLEYQAVSHSDDEDLDKDSDEYIDPRWDALRKLKNK